MKPTADSWNYPRAEAMHNRVLPRNINEPVMHPLRYNAGGTGYERVLRPEPWSFRFTLSTEF
jgi:hypothetical protein